jgi:CTP:phosphocholine cytidylyltransferase-like protein
MKVIVINEKGAFKHLNLRTFEVSKSNGILDLNTSFACVIYSDIKVDVPLKNVLIVDADVEIQNIYTDAEWYSKYLPLKKGIQKWAEIHGFDLSKIQVPVLPF